MDGKSNIQKLLSQFDYDFRSFTMESFAAWVMEHVGREIIFIHKEMEGGLFGTTLYMPNDPKVYIFYRSNLPKIQQVHAQLHELSHLLCGHHVHGPYAGLNSFILHNRGGNGQGSLFPGIHRMVLDNEMEMEAEMLASLIQEKVIKHNRIEQLSKVLSSEENYASMLVGLGLDK